MAKRLALSWAVAILVGVDSSWAADCIALVVARLGRAPVADADVVVRFAAGVEKGSPAGDGLIAAIDSRRDDGITRVRDIIVLFDEPAARVQFERLSLVAHVGTDRGLGDLVVNLGKAEPSARGAEAVLEWATTRMDPSAVSRFEFRPPGATHVADMLDTSGNLLEFKNLRWDRYNGFTVRAEFRDGLEQMRDFIQYAEANGTTASFIFKRPIPAEFRTTFDELSLEILGDLRNSTQYVVVEGF